MSDGFDIYTVIILVLAVFIFLRLRSVLGTRTGNERRPSDPFVGRPQVKPEPANYNAAHSTIAPLLLLSGSALLDDRMTLGLALIWLA
ncbi:hypothetical protein ACIKTA_13120, partial [Hansschlegelia beijingensis]